MVTAIVLIRADTDRVPDLESMIVETDGVKELFSVAGRYDLVAIVKVPSNEGIADVVTDKLRKLDGIMEAETLIAFRAYSKADWDTGFDLGLD